MLTQEWHKATASGVNGNCVRARLDARGVCVQVGDSKAPALLPMEFSQDEWRAFLDGVKKGEFDLAE